MSDTSLYIDNAYSPKLCEVDILFLAFQIKSLNLAEVKLLTQESRGYKQSRKDLSAPNLCSYPS